MFLLNILIFPTRLDPSKDQRLCLYILLVDSQISLTHFVENRLSFRFVLLSKDSSFIERHHQNEIQAAVLDPHPLPFNQFPSPRFYLQNISWISTSFLLYYYHFSPGYFPLKTKLFLLMPPFSHCISHIVAKRSNIYFRSSQSSSENPLVTPQTLRMKTELLIMASH